MDRLSEELTQALKSIVEACRDEDRTVRLRQVRNYKKLKYYFDGITYLYDGGIAHDWQVWSSQFFNGQNSGVDQDSIFYDKNINVYKAFIETIIAALSVTVPTIKAYPDDANNMEDMATAKAADAIYQLIKKHNDLPLKWIHSLFVYCTEGLTWAYNYTDCDVKYGTYEKNEYEDITEDVTEQICSICKQQLVPQQFTDQLENEYGRDESDVELVNGLNNEMVFCPNCAVLVNPELQQSKLVVQKIVGKTTEPKSRECIEVYGGLNVKTSIYAKNMEELTYLQLTDEINIWKAMYMWRELRTKFHGDKLRPNVGSPDIVDSWIRSSTQYLGINPDNVCTRERTWLKCEAFQRLNDEKQIEELEELFPFGCKVTMINDEIVEVEPEDMMDHWTPTVNPNGDFMQFDPLGNSATSIQDIIRDLTSLTLQTIEHGIPQTFADPGLLDFNAYKQTEVRPGHIFPMKSPTGKPLQDGIMNLKTAQLGGEVLPFSEQVMELGQLTTGALPQLSGGSADNSSKTASQYAMQQRNAMQRLRTAWVMTSYWWKNTFGKVIPSYIKCITESGDERFVVKNESGRFINVEIRIAELNGKLGSIELESSDELPATFAQRKEIVMMLLNSPNQLIFEALTDPSNLPVLQEAIGLDNFHLPGEADREKQMEEIRLLLQSQPIMDPMANVETPSIRIEPLVDNHALEAEVCREWLKSDEGRLAKIENQAGYKNVLLHMEQHVNYRRMMMQQSAGMQQNQNPNNEVNKVPTQKPAIAQGTPDERSESPVTIN